MTRHFHKKHSRHLRHYPCTCNTVEHSSCLVWSGVRSYLHDLHVFSSYVRTVRVYEYNTHVYIYLLFKPPLVEEYMSWCRGAYICTNRFTTPSNTLSLYHTFVSTVVCCPYLYHTCITVVKVHYFRY